MTLDQFMALSREADDANRAAEQANKDVVAVTKRRDRKVLEAQALRQKVEEAKAEFAKGQAPAKK